MSPNWPPGRRELLEQQPPHKLKFLIEQCKWTAGLLTYRWKRPFDPLELAEQAKAALGGRAARSVSVLCSALTYKWKPACDTSENNAATGRYDESSPAFVAVYAPRPSVWLQRMRDMRVIFGVSAVWR